MAGPWERYQQPSGPWDRYADQPAPPPRRKPEEEEEEAGFLLRTGRSIVRGIGPAISGYAKSIEELPEALASASLQVVPSTALVAPYVEPALRGIARWATPGYKESVAPLTAGIRSAGEGVRTSVAPRSTPGFYEALETGGPMGALASIGETVAESAAPTLAGLAAGYVTRSPRVAAAVIGAGTVPQTYTGIREDQASKGIDDIGAAVRGTAASSALDILTGSGGKALSVAREAAEGVLSAGIRRAALEVAKTGGEEGGTEILQNVIEQVAGGTDPTTKEAMLQTLEAGLAGVVGGAAFGTVGEGLKATLPKRPVTELDAEVPPEIANAPPISTIEIEDVEGKPTRLDILSPPDERGNVWVRSENGTVRSVPRAIIEQIGGFAEQPVETPPIEEPLPPPVVEPPVAEPPVAEPPVAEPPLQPELPLAEPPVAEPPVAEPPVAEPPVAEPPLQPEPPLAEPPVAQPPVVELPVEQPSGPVIQDEATRNYWSSNLARQRGQLVRQRDSLANEATALEEAAVDLGPEDIDGYRAQQDDLGKRIDAINTEIASVDEEIAGLDQEQAPTPRARPLDDNTAVVADQADEDLANAVRDLPATGVMDWFAQNASTDFHRELAKRVGGLMKAMENSGFQFNWGIYNPNYQPRDAGEQANFDSVMGSPTTKGAAWTQSKEKAKAFGPDRALNKVDIGVKDWDQTNSGANEVTILHEFAHAVTSAAIYQLKYGNISPNSRVGKAVKELELLRNAAVKHRNKLLNDIASGKPIDARLKLAVQRLEKTNAWTKGKKGKPQQEPIIHELIVQGLTSIDMQIFLKSMPYKKSNGFVEFIREIGRLIGVTEKDMNGLRRLFELTDELIPTDAAAQQDVIQAMMKPLEYGATPAPTPSQGMQATAPTASEETPSPANTQTQSRVGDVLFDQRDGLGQVPLNENVNYRGFTAMMRPSKFLELAADLRGEEKQDTVDFIESHISNGQPIGSPFLNIDFDAGKVTGHEGRHRMLAIQRVNGDAPVPVHVFGNGEDRARNLDPDKIAKFRQNLRPEDGGASTNNFEDAFWQGDVLIAKSEPTAPTSSELLTPEEEAGREAAAAKPTSKEETGVPTGPQAARNAQGRTYLQIPLGDETRLDRWRRYWADRMRRLGFVEEAIEKATGHPLPRTARPTEKASLFEGRATERLEDLQKKHIDGIIKYLQEEGITPNEADLFLLARTARDRNAKVARRNPSMPDGGSGLTNAEAQAILLEFINNGSMAKMQGLADLVDAMTKQTRDTMVDYGLLTRKEADRYEQEEPFYVPLKGLALDGDMSVSGDRVHREPGAGRGFSVSRKDFKAVKGRSTLPFSPLANAISDAQAAIIRGERNRVGLSFLKDIALKYPSNAWSVYTEKRPDVQRVYNSKTKKVEERPVPMDMFPDRYFVVKDKGVPFYIKIEDPILMRALTNGSSKDFAFINKLLGSSIGAVTKTLSRLFTTFNPEFFVPNFVRDIESAVFNILAEQDAVDGRVAGKKIVKNVLNDIRSIKNLRAIFGVTFGRPPANAQQQQLQDLFNQARLDGAFTGWILKETPQEQIEKIERALAKASATGKEKLWYSTLDGAGTVLKAVEDFNSVFENVTRFAVYKNALDAGLTRDEAAGMARNVTVDFNKKGEAGPTANALYAFFNAAVRGNAQLVRTLTAKPVNGKFTRAQKLAAGMIALGIIQTLVGRGMSDEDDDGMLFYDKIPDWEKQRNIIVMSPDGENYLKIPLPYGYSFFHTLGSLLSEVGTGAKSAGDGGIGVVSGLLNNFAPIQIGGGSLSGIATSVVPTALKPLADLMINENFFGSPIYQEPFDENQALSSVSRYSTPEGYKAVVQFLNEATGGTGIVKGHVDIPAEALQYLVTSYIGGAGKFGVDAINLARDASAGRDVELRSVPLLRKVMGEPNQQADLGLYFDRINDIGPVSRQLKNAKGMERKVLREKFPVETSPRLISAMKAAQSDLRELSKKKKLLMSQDLGYDQRQDRLDALNERQHDVYLKFNTIYNQVAEREGAPPS